MSDADRVPGVPHAAHGATDQPPKDEILTAEICHDPDARRWIDWQEAAPARTMDAVHRTATVLVTATGILLAMLIGLARDARPVAHLAVIAALTLFASMLTSLRVIWKRETHWNAWVPYSIEQTYRETLQFKLRWLYAATTSWALGTAAAIACLAHVLFRCEP
jgi:hypothetical protein